MTSRRQRPPRIEDSNAYAALGGWAVIVTHTARQVRGAEEIPFSHKQPNLALGTAALRGAGQLTLPGIKRPALTTDSTETDQRI